MSNTSTNSQPSHRIYAVSKRGDDKKAFWQMIGFAWPHKDGKGYNLSFIACPIGDARVVIRVPRAEDEAVEAA